jgi:CheY-like chemotaxis protein
MVTCEEFEQELQEALAHLYDPRFNPSESLCVLTGCDPGERAIGVQSAILRTIKDLEPSPDTPSRARTRLIYELLHSRFVLKLTQEETAQRLHISVASAWRVQREAIHTLARFLWENNSERRLLTGKEPPEEKRPGGQNAQALDWRSQVKQELASLRASTPDAIADVAEVIDGVLELEEALVSRHNVRLKVVFVQPELVATVHPSALHQILIAAIGRLARYTPSGDITIFAGLEDGNARITIAGSVTTEKRPTERDLIQDILAPEEVSISAHIDGDHVFLWVELPSLGKVTVLVVDDNPDMADFYRRCTEGTSYHITHITKGQSLFEAVEATRPDIIVLDVMLPDIDGWKLLMRLYEDPATRPIPVIVCSVVREEELALSLGATLYLAKPMRPREFIQGLDQALSQVPTGALTSPANSAIAC